MPTSDRPRPARPSSDTAELRPATIVYADDDRVTRELLAATLRGAGHVVIECEDGQEALERVSQGGVDLVLLDIVMPRLGGLEACRILKGMAGETFLPVILVTVKTDTASRVEGLRIGADDYVCKPVEEAELLARLTAMLRIKRVHDNAVAQRAKFERLSVHDEPTGLYNYRYLHTRLAEEFKRAERYHEPFACIVIDIDQLRAINEREGRAAGDQVIKIVAEGVKRSVREVDVVARYGGEEFLVILPSTHFAGSVTVAERIWRETAEQNRGLRVSIGVALYPSRDVRTKDALLRAADTALAQAKREGGNRICVFQQQGYIYTPALTRARADDAPRSERAGARRASEHPDPDTGVRRTGTATDPSSRDRGS